jgi:hypothetical protein
VSLDRGTGPLLNDHALGARRGGRQAIVSRTFLRSGALGGLRFYANVTTETRATSIRIRPPRGGGSVAGTLRYSTESNLPVYVFTPDHETPEDRIAFFDVSYRCISPTQVYSTTFMLTIRGTDRAAPAGTTPSMEAGSGRPQVKPEPAGCADLGITLEPTSGLLLYGQERDVTVAVQNLGPEPVNSATSVVVFSTRLGVQTWSSPDDPGIAVRGETERTLVWTTGPLQPGAAVHLVVTVLGQSAGVAPITAVMAEEDCNPLNDWVDGELTVSHPPVPELTGQWGPLSIAPPAAGERPRRQHVEGLLTVRNENYADARATRVVVFLSKDPVPGPEDRLLGFGDVPALPSRTETTVGLSFDMSPSHSTRGMYVLAVIDSSNYAFESSETNNLVVSPRLP